MSNDLSNALLRFSGVAFGSRTVPSEEVDAAFGMPVGKLRHRAGILSLAYAASGESELTLAAAAAGETLRNAQVSPGELDWIIASSETHRAIPSLAAQLHAAIGARETCGALDVGGACLGLVHALVVAKSFVESRQAGTVLAVTADVHSRTLTPGRVAGEFGGLFGDGAAAFLVQRQHNGTTEEFFALRDFFFGCASRLQAAIEVSAEPGDRIHELECRSGIARSEAAAFATHQPNPRLVALLAKKSGVALERFPMIAATRGNLGSTTCAAALHFALEASRVAVARLRRPIFVASLGPGLLFGGGWLAPTSIPDAGS